MFFAHMTGENRLSSYDLEKKDTNVPEDSITIVNNSNAKVVCSRILSPLDSIQIKVWFDKQLPSTQTAISVSRPEEEDVENKEQRLSQEIK